MTFNENWELWEGFNSKALGAFDRMFTIVKALFILSRFAFKNSFASTTIKSKFLWISNELIKDLSSPWHHFRTTPNSSYTCSYINKLCHFQLTAEWENILHHLIVLCALKFFHSLGGRELLSFKYFCHSLLSAGGKSIETVFLVEEKSFSHFWCFTETKVK